MPRPRIKMTPEEYPIKEGESWWVVHPNNGNVVFAIPDSNAITVCIEAFKSFMCGKVYQISDNDEINGYITLGNSAEIVEMPYYLFARFFDAEAFVTPEANYNKRFAQKAKQQNLLDIKFEG